MAATTNLLRHVNPGSNVWYKDDKTGWCERELKEFDESGKCVVLSDGTRVKSDRVAPCNPPVLDGVEDMIALSHLNEPSLLHNIAYRYHWDLMYTNVGGLLVAVNPYKRLPIFTPGMVAVHSENHSRPNGPLKLAPHVFNVADEAYRNLLKTRKCQSLVISGESGAGKTETTKFIMQYLAHVGGREGVGVLERQILETNPILEAFGNAKTLRNDNSSRFGKFIQIMFDGSGIVAGTVIRNYLLEKCRLITQAHGERNYHIFYQLCSGADEAMKARFELGPMEEFSIIGGSGTYEAATAYPDGETDAEYFQVVTRAMRDVGITEIELEAILRIIAGLLHLGNVSFVSKDEDGETSEIGDQGVLTTTANMLQIDESGLLQALCTKRIMSGGEVIVSPRRTLEAGQSRDALGKAVYRHLFDWLVARINVSLASKEGAVDFIGLLDIFGFESFDVNSFEQLCINYANEKLQKFFNDNVLEAEQAEYIAEEIQWSYIDFQDNQPCLDLIEKKPMGILPLLDEECLLGSAADDDSLWTKLANQNGKHSHFAKARFSRRGFSVRHYAGAVEYDVTGFLDKNNDVLHQDLTNLMLESKGEFLLSLFKQGAVEAATMASVGAEGGGSRGGGGSGGGHGRGRSGSTKRSGKPFVSVGGQFKEQLGDLMHTLAMTCPFFVRCIKPNPQKVANSFDKMAVSDQLRNGGVVEAVRVTQAGFPTRFVFDELYESMSYKVLLPFGVRSTLEAKQGLKTILENCGFDPEAYRFGKTKLFFRVGILAQLESVRQRASTDAAVSIQCAFRAMSARRLLHRVRATLTLQCAVRRCGLRQHWIHSFVGLWLGQCAVRRSLQSRYHQKRHAITGLQCALRQHVARAVLIREMIERSNQAIVLQDRVRAQVARDQWIEVYLRARAGKIIARGALRFMFLRRVYNRKIANTVAQLQAAMRVAVARRRVSRRRAARQLSASAKACLHFLAMRQQRHAANVLCGAIGMVPCRRRYLEEFAKEGATKTLSAAIAMVSPRKQFRSTIEATAVLAPWAAMSWRREGFSRVVAANTLEGAARMLLQRPTFLNAASHARGAKVIGRTAAQANARNAWKAFAISAATVSSASRAMVQREWYRLHLEDLRRRDADEAEARREHDRVTAIIEHARKTRREIVQWKDIARSYAKGNGTADAPPPKHFVDIEDVASPLARPCAVMAKLAVPEMYTLDGGALHPLAPTLRREYARWLHGCNNAMLAEEQPRLALPLGTSGLGARQAFADVDETDPDYDVIQGLAESGVVPSPLIDRDNSDVSLFRPNDVLTREELLVMKNSLDSRGVPNETASVTDVVRVWQFHDADAITSTGARSAVVSDADLEDDSTIRRCLWAGLLFLPDKAVTHAEAVSSLVYIGTHDMGCTGVHAEDILDTAGSAGSLCGGVIDALRARAADAEAGQVKATEQEKSLRSQLMETVGEQATSARRIMELEQALSDATGCVSAAEARSKELEASNRAREVEASELENRLRAECETLRKSDSEREAEVNEVLTRLSDSESRFEQRTKLLDDERQRVADDLNKALDDNAALKQDLAAALQPKPESTESALGRAVLELMDKRLPGKLNKGWRSVWARVAPDVDVEESLGDGEMATASGSNAHLQRHWLTLAFDELPIDAAAALSALAVAQDGIESTDDSDVMQGKPDTLTLVGARTGAVNTRVQKNTTNGTSLESAAALLRQIVHNSSSIDHSIDKNGDHDHTIANADVKKEQLVDTAMSSRAGAAMLVESAVRVAVDLVAAANASDDKAKAVATALSVRDAELSELVNAVDKAEAKAATAIAYAEEAEIQMRNLAQTHAANSRSMAAAQGVAHAKSPVTSPLSVSHTEAAAVRLRDAEAEAERARSLLQEALQQKTRLEVQALLSTGDEASLRKIRNLESETERLQSVVAQQKKVAHERQVARIEAEELSAHRAIEIQELRRQLEQARASGGGGVGARDMPPSLDTSSASVGKLEPGGLRDTMPYNGKVNNEPAHVHGPETGRAIEEMKRQDLAAATTAASVATMAMEEAKRCLRAEVTAHAASCRRLRTVEAERDALAATLGDRGGVTQRTFPFHGNNVNGSVGGGDMSFGGSHAYGAENDPPYDNNGNNGSSLAMGAEEEHWEAKVRSWTLPSSSS